MESLTHALFEFPHSQAIWKKASFWDVIKGYREGFVMNMLLVVFWNLEKDAFVVFCTMLW